MYNYSFYYKFCKVPGLSKSSVEYKTFLTGVSKKYLGFPPLDPRLSFKKRVNIRLLCSIFRRFLGFEHPTFSSQLVWAAHTRGCFLPQMLLFFTVKELHIIVSLWKGLKHIKVTESETHQVCKFESALTSEISDWHPALITNIEL